jgi:hypothetical protein
LLGFGLYPRAGHEATLAHPETIIWSSIHHLCSRSAGEWYAWKAHGVSNRRARSVVARNLKLYIQQASEFYHAAASAKPNTAPLIYYYSFLNLAKALCEMRNPGFHERDECYAHGLSWKPDPRTLVNFAKEKVTIRGRGVWHVLWECLMRMPCPAAGHTQVAVRTLFSYCPEISSEFLGVFGGPLPHIEFKNPNLLYDAAQRETWLRFSVRRQELKDQRLSGPKLIAQMKTVRSTYVEVKEEDRELRTYESATAKKLGRGGTPWSALESDIFGLNLFAHFGTERELQYSFALQNSLPLRFPQLVVSYTILFWLGSLVRYDPHSVQGLMDSPYWILIDGFMTQSRVWLLELFEWALYQKETVLHMAR